MFVKIIIQDLNVADVLDAMHRLQLIMEPLFLLLLHLIALEHCLESKLLDFFRDPFLEFVELLLVLVGALLVQEPMVQFHDFVNVLVVQLMGEEAHLEEFLIGVLADADSGHAANHRPCSCREGCRISTSYSTHH